MIGIATKVEIPFSTISFHVVEITMLNSEIYEFSISYSCVVVNNLKIRTFSFEVQV